MPYRQSPLTVHGADRVGLASEAALHIADRVGVASEAALHRGLRLGSLCPGSDNLMP
jgi:hypothetical protein